MKYLFLFLALATHALAQLPLENPDNASAVRRALGLGITTPKEDLASTILVHDAMYGANGNYAAAATRTAVPGPGIMTVGAISGSSIVRYENGEMIIAGFPGSGTTMAHWGAQTAAAGLTMIAEVIPSWRPGQISQTRVGFSHTTNFHTERRGNVILTATTAPTYLEGMIQISKLTTDTDDTAYTHGFGIYSPGERMRVAVHYKSLSHQQYYIQGGSAKDFGCIVGSDNWFLVGESFCTLSGTVYPMISNQYSGITKVLSVQVLSQWSPSPRHTVFDYSRARNGIHIPSLGRDPVTGLVVFGWNNGLSHWANGQTTIRGAVKLPDGSWTAAQDLIDPVEEPQQIHISSISPMGGKLYLCWLQGDRTTVESIPYRSELTVNPTTGEITVGTAQAMLPQGEIFSENPIIEVASGRLFMPMHGDELKPVFAYSDDDGETWTTGLISDTANVVEPTFIEESDGAVGCVMRSYTNATLHAWYARCANPNANPPTWSALVALKEIPQSISGVATTGNRMNLTKLDNGQILLIGSDSTIGRQNITIWEMADNGQITGKIRVGDWNTRSTASAILQYPAILQDGEDLLIGVSHENAGVAGTTLSCMMRVMSWRWAQPVAVEAGGTGFRSVPRPPTPIRQPVPAVSLAFAAAPVPDLSVGNLFDLRLTASTATIGVPLNPLPWETLTLIVTQATSGPWTLAFNAVFEMNGATTTLQTAVNASNVFVFRYNGFTNKWVLESFN
jgi:hypothetical protein